MRLSTLKSGLGAGIAFFASAASVVADTAVPIIGKPVDGAMGFQPAATIVARHMHGLESMITGIMAAIVIFVSLLLVYVMIRFNKKANPTPAKFTHNSPLEIAWTLIPIVILVIIGAYSLPVLFLEEEIPVADMTVKVTGNQWFWSYAYKNEGIGFDSFMLAQDKLQASGYDQSDYRLAVDNPLVVPVGKTVVLQITGADVIHSWKVPAFGVMQDAVPGRVAEAWFKADSPGVYYGQCSELCGKDHAFMPVEVKVLSQDDYDKWLVTAKKLFASAEAPAASVQLAAN